MSARLPCILLACMAPGLATAAQVSGVLTADETWTPTDNPYTVVADLTVAAGVSLTIEPGVEVLLAPGVNLYVEGELQAKGTAEAEILFAGAEESPWGSLVFRAGSVDAAFNGLDTWVSGSILEHAVFEGGTRAVQLEGASPYLHACTFRGNTCTSDLTVPGGAALLVADGSTARVRACVFEDNLADGYAQGGAVYVDDANPIFQDNQFSGNRSVYGGALSTFGQYSPMVGNLFQDNISDWEGGAVAFVSSSPAFLNNRVLDNRSVTDGGGVHVCTTCFPHANPALLDNTITGNTNTVYGAAGVGAAYLRAFSGNNLHNNLLAGEPADFGWFNEQGAEGWSWVVDVDIAGNWWGTTDPDDVEDTIFDGQDEDGFGLVTFEPMLEAPVQAPSPQVVITTHRIEYGTPGEALPVYLTLYNPGEALEVELLLTVSYGAGSTAFYHGDLGFPDEILSGDAHLLVLPANSAWFTVLMEPAYAAAEGFQEGWWQAALFDRTTGERLGAANTCRFALTMEE